MMAAQGSDGALAVPLAEELLGAALPGLSDLCALLRSQPGYVRPKPPHPPSVFGIPHDPAIAPTLLSL